MRYPGSGLLGAPLTLWLHTRDCLGAPLDAKAGLQQAYVALDNNVAVNADLIAKFKSNPVQSPFRSSADDARNEG